MPTGSDPIYLPELREMLATNNIEEMREFCQALHPVRAAEFMDGLEPAEIWAILKNADRDTVVEIFSYFDESLQVDIFEAAPRDEIADLIERLPSDDRVDVLQSTDKDVVAELMPLVDNEDRRDIQRLSAFPDDTCGAEMTTDFVRLRESMTVEEAFAEISRQTSEIETVYYLYVVDKNDHLVGLVSARQLLTAMGRPQAPIRDLMKRDLITVRADEDREVAANEVARFDFLAIPVVDSEHRMLGIITHDDVLDVMVEELTEDVQRSAAVEPLSESYLDTSPFLLARKRIIWLVLLFFGSILTAYALKGFDHITRNISWLIVFLPMIISTGGNTGGQSVALITTALSTGEVTTRDWWRVLVREIISGLILALAMGLCGLVCALVVSPPEVDSWQDLLVVPLAVTCVVFSGGLIGSMLPILFRRLGWDPALMSNPFVAGIEDVLGTIIYLSIAGFFLLR